MMAMTEYGFDHSRRRTFRAFTTNSGKPKSRGTGTAQHAPGYRGASAAAAASARARASTPQNSPATVGPDPDTNAWSAPAPRTAASAASISGHSDTAAGRAR